MNRVALSDLIVFWHTCAIGVFLRVELLGHRVFICLPLTDIDSFPKWLYYIHSI